MSVLNLARTRLDILKRVKSLMDIKPIRMESNSIVKQKFDEYKNNDADESTVVVSTCDDLNEGNKKKLKVDQESSANETNQSASKKRKYALLIGYCGEGYYGLQRNAFGIKEHRTIEDEIVDALVDVKAIPQEHANEMYKMSFQRAARTDKGVSAAQNLLSLKMILEENTISELNKRLPKQIRVFSYNKVTQGFDCKQNCDARTYMYILPTFAFCPIEEMLTESYRASPDTIKKVNELLRNFMGTKNFHNFTSGRKYTDPSAKRYIMSFECSEPFVREGFEFCAIKIKGQSFMLHQIRKMIGLIIAVVRGFASEENIANCWTAAKIEVPKAPPLGLLLQQLHYDLYDRKYGKDGVHKPIQWPELEAEIEQFKEEFIYSNIIKREISTRSMFNWLSRLPVYHFGPINPNVQTRAYTGLGKAYGLVQKYINEDKEDDD